MKILVTGVTGQLGSVVLRLLQDMEEEVLGVCRKEMDLTCIDEVKNVILNFRPNIIIHMAAYTDVVGAEKNVKKCMDTNVYGTMHIAYYAKVIDATVIYISSDYVFDGTKDTPYTESDAPNPLNVYGVSKLKGEKVIKQLLDKYFILRTSWLFGVKGNNFVKKMVQGTKVNTEIEVVSDQVGSPTYALDLAKFIVELIPSTDYGTYHVASDNYLSWYGFSLLIFKMLDKNILVNPVTTSEVTQNVLRPLNSRLSMDKLDEHKFKRLPRVQDALKRYLQVESFQ